uniref:dTDP-4-dehydrorhamnose reductase n=1 Tax=uncultured Mameliella sp. TaxID=1447087 RepID=UPI0026299B29
ACAAAIETHDPRAVINAAAWTAVDRAEEHEAEASAVNGDAPAAMAQACAARGIPLVHISTDYVFAGSGTDPWVETDPVAPQNAYGRTKLAGEEGVRAAGGPHAILRTSWVVSAHGANFVKTMLRLGAERDRLTIVADQVGGPTPAADIAQACLEIAGQLIADPGKSGTYHFSGGPDVSWADFAREIFAQAGLSPEVADIPTTDFPTPAKRPLNSRLDNGALTATFGIARPDWRAGLKDILADIGASK